MKIGAVLVDALQAANKHLEFIVDVAESIIKGFEKRINLTG